MKYVCQICGYVYDDEKQKIPFAELPDDWHCPLCGAAKSDFKPLEEQKPVNNQAETKTITPLVTEKSDMVELSFGALSSVCSNLARGCEKQYLTEEAKKYRTLANYFLSIAKPEKDATFDNLIKLIEQNLSIDYPEITEVATNVQDRGALRVKVWSEKVTLMLKSLLERYGKNGEEMLENTNVWVCSVCGFIYVGENAPEICPVCKVQNNKFIKVGGDD